MQITPISTKLQDVIEGEYVEQYFIASPEANETVISLSIIDYQPVSGISVSETHYKGNYNSVFTFGNDALKYRQGDELKTASSWEDLPNPKEADLYLWQAPRSLERTFTYTVKVIYSVTEESSGGSSGGSTAPVVTRHEMTKTYSQTVKGNWSLWADKLRAYVYGGN
ncbi:hypothetical protein CPT_Metamorpho_120 [Klebsiella phage Metamorpho]|nr:hypothetical protein CPT_Metamorpho_120 [Klebsiella phage Metamorpho]